MYIASLGEVATQFRTPLEGDLERHLTIAMAAMTLKRPVLKSAVLTLSVHEPYYTADLPSDIDQVHSIDWPVPSIYPPPRLLYQPGFITVSPTPSAAVVAYSPTIKYLYYATQTAVSLRDADVPLLILRAQVEAMRELAMRAHQKPVSLRGGSVGSLSNMQPSALYQMLLAEFEACK